MGSIFEGWGLDFGSFPRRFWLDFAVFQQGLGLDFGGFGNSFWIYFGCLGGSGCQVRLGMCFGRLSGRSWSRLGAVLGPKMDQVTPKLPPKPNPIGVLGRLEGYLERPKSVLVRFKAASSIAHEKRWKIDLVLVPWNMIIP